jgi:hypothetical protein
MGRRRKMALLAIVCLVGVAALAWLNRPRDEPTKATVDEAVRSFRAKSDSGGHGGGPGEPALGVYRYDTSGSESMKSAILGATHDYGGVSTITLSAGVCGEREQWQVLAERWTEAETCAPHGERLAALTEFHEFFGFGQEEEFRCDGEAPTGPRSLRDGAHFSNLCKSDGSSISSSSRIVGTDRVSVGGETFDTLHIESRSVLKGDTSGTAKREEWRRRSDGVLLRRSAESDADTSAGGGSHYTERYTIRLLSATPRR